MVVNWRQILLLLRHLYCSQSLSILSLHALFVVSLTATMRFMKTPVLCSITGLLFVGEFLFRLVIKDVSPIDMKVDGENLAVLCHRHDMPAVGSGLFAYRGCHLSIYRF